MKAIYASGVLATAIVISFSATSPLVAQAPGEWRPLLNGKDLTGWTVAAGRGGAAPGAPAPQPAQWKVEDGVLVGGQGGGRGSLVTTDQFKDFELDLELHAVRARDGVLGGAGRARTARTRARNDRAFTTAASASGPAIS